MDKVLKPVSRLLIFVGSCILLYLLVGFVAAVIQLAEASDRLYLGLGQPVFIGMMSLFAALVASPIYMYYKLPRALIPPDMDSGFEHDRYMVQLRSRLKNNPKLVGVSLDTDEDVKSALKILSNEAGRIIRKTAKNVFIGTAISQNGRIDGLITLVTQAKMVWQVACIYNQRPSPRQMLYLYSNVAANVLLAESIDDIDLSEITGPLFSSVGFGAAAAIPGASVIMNSIANGTANAFLTLRVGCIANQYCESTSKPNKSIVRRTATIAAASLVVGIVKENGASILTAAWKVVTRSTEGVVDAVKSATGNVTDSVSHGLSSVGDTFCTVASSAKNATAKVGDTVSQVAKMVGNSMGNVVDKVPAGHTDGRKCDGM